MNLSASAILVALAAATVLGVANAEAQDLREHGSQPAPNTLSDAERAAGWRLLFNGRDLAGWRGFQRQSAPSGWKAVDETLARVGRGGDLITVDRFENFELQLEWNVAPGGNSGVFYRASEDTERMYESAPEMQVLDDAAHQDGLSRLTAAGSNYGLHGVPEGIVRPAGHWNQVRILVDGAHVEHWLNGVKVVEYELWTDEWEDLVRNSKFAEWPAYGRTRVGHIGLQDHGDAVAFRNLKIRVLP